MAPPQLKRQKAALLNISSESDRAASAEALPQLKSRGAKSALQPMANDNQNVPKYQKATCEVGKRFMEAMLFTKTLWP